MHIILATLFKIAKSTAGRPIMEIKSHTNWLIAAYSLDLNISRNNKNAESKIENVNDQKKEIKTIPPNPHHTYKIFS